LGLVTSGIVKVKVSPPFIKVAVEAILPLTKIYCFFKAFFKADFVGIKLKIPTPYSCRRIGVGNFGTVCNSCFIILSLNKLLHCYLL